MNPEFEKIPERLEYSFMAKWVERPHRPLLSQAWHFHPELEICYTQTSHGKRFVGNRIDDYSQGDLVMFGSSLPHGFITDVSCRQVVIQLNKHFLGNEFISKPELWQVKNLFEESKCGLEFGEETKKTAIKIISKVMKSEGLEKTINLLLLLDTLAKSSDKKSICSKEYSINLDESNLKRMKIVYDHVIENFQFKIKVREVADKINLSEPAFYKFIRKHTKKTYTEIVNEFRISHASKQLISSEMSISQICFDSGFNNISYFNRKFKAILKKTPHEFRDSYEGRK